MDDKWGILTLFPLGSKNAKRFFRIFISLGSTCDLSSKKSLRSAISPVASGAFFPQHYFTLELFLHSSKAKRKFWQNLTQSRWMLIAVLQY